MTLQRVAIVFDHKVRPDTTGVYCRRALGKLVEIEHFLPEELNQIPRQGFDLYLHIDDGLEYTWPTDLRPSAWWAIDTHLDYPWRLEKARLFDCVFAAQRDGAARLRQDGIASATWLPLACDPDLHCQYDINKSYDVCFVGHLFEGPRLELVDLIQKKFRNTFVGQRFFDDMARTYSASHIVFNRSIRNDINMRVFEALACGSLLVTNDLADNGQAELFQDGVHLATYRNADELIDKIQFYLEKDAIRERIAAAGREEVLAKHTYQHRMATLLTEIDKRLATVTASPGAAIAGNPHIASQSFSWAKALAELPPPVKNVLAIDFGAGGLQGDIQSTVSARVVGLARQNGSPESSTNQSDQIWVKDLDRIEASFASESFDAVVCQDVLEHVRAPRAILKQMRSWLRPDGRLLAAIPNVRHNSVVRSLLEGNWTYEASGLLDQEHIRFFTRREMEKMLARAGFTIAAVQVIPGPGYDEWHQQGRPGEVKVGHLHLGPVPPEEAEEFYVGHYLIQAAPVQQPDWGVTSIVILTHNELDFTRQCLDSIRHYTDEPYELIMVDNASTDGTVEYLQAQADITLIRNDSNRGFPAAANQGIQAAKGRQVLLLNNDTLATTCWLTRLLQALYHDPKIGLAGPCSNFTSGPQQVLVAYDDLVGLDSFAWEWGKAKDRGITDIDRLVGFCLLIRREVIDRIGLLDEQFGLGCFEDDDYCLRAIKAGFRAVIAQDAFVHHYGGRTFVGSGVDFSSLMQKNEQLFRAKWEQTLLTEVQPDAPTKSAPSSNGTPFTLRRAPGGGLLLQRAGIHLSMCMIARDSSRTIGAALESIRRWVDEMIVVDTGSKDNTADIAAGLGARVFHFPWPDSFAIARNESIRHARGKWIFWMDTDDTIDEVNGRKLRALAYQAHDSSILGYVMQVHCPGPGEEGQYDITVVDHVKLFRHLKNLYFEGRIHEQILSAISRAGGNTAWTDIFVVHSGYDHTPAGQARKNERDLRLLHLELKEQPRHPFTLFNLGMTYAHMGQPEEAIGYLQRSLQNSGPNETHLRKAYALLLHSQNEAGQREEAWQTCQEGLRRFPTDVELRFRKGVLLHQQGRNHEAIQEYLGLLQPTNDRHFSSIDPAFQGFKARQNLAAVYTDSGDLPRALEQWQHIVQEKPKYRMGWHGLGETLLRQGRKADVLALVEQLLKENNILKLEGKLLLAQLAVACSDPIRARQELEVAVKEYPDELDPLQNLCQVLFEQGEYAEAEIYLNELSRRNPTDASAHFNLGTIYMKTHRHSAAVEAYQESIRFRPKSANTHFFLGNALKECGRLVEAKAAWENALRLEPQNAQFQEAIRRAPSGEPRS